VNPALGQFNSLTDQKRRRDTMPDLQGIKKAKSKGKKANRGPQDFKKQKVKVGRKVRC